MTKHRQHILVRLHRWRLKHLGERGFLTVLSIVIGVLAGIAAVIIKNTVRFTEEMVHNLVSNEVQNYIYFALPVVGIFLAILVIKYIVRSEVRHGIPNVLHSISKRKGKISRHNLFSSVVTASLTVGFGGSVGLEGPTVATGTAWGSWIANIFRLNYKNTILMLACACAGAMAAIFKAPIAAIVFAVEVIMIDLTVFSLVPLLLASSTAVLTSYLFLGQDVLYPFNVVDAFELGDLPYYIALGIVTGFVSVYFTKMYLFIADIFEKFKSSRIRLVVGGAGLGALIFLFPALYGEGYESINECLAGDLNYLFDNSLFYSLREELWAAMLLIVAVILLKIVATSLTFGAGGVGGIFAPTLFMGVNTGMLFSLIPGILKAYFMVNEMVVTLMLNYVVAVLVKFLAEGVFKDPSSGYVSTYSIAPGAMLVRLFNSELTLFFFISAAAFIIMLFVFRKSRLGYEITAIGKNPEFAEASGMKVRNKIMAIMVISGALSGLAGAGFLMSEKYRFTLDFSGSPGLGWDGMLIALLGRHNPVGVLISAVLYAALKTGSDYIDLYTNVPKDIVGIIQGILILFLSFRFIDENFKVSGRLGSLLKKRKKSVKEEGGRTV